MLVGLALPLSVLAPRIKDSGLLIALLVNISNVGMMIIPSLFCTWAICRIARRAGLTWKLTSLACLPVLLIALHLVTQVQYTPTSEVHGTYRVGISLPLLGIDSLGSGWSPFIQAAVPVLILIGMMARESRRSLELSS